MSFGIEQEGGSLIVPMALAHPLHPINDRSRNKRRNLWVGWCVSSWWPMFTSRSSVSLYIYLYVCILYTGSGYRMYIYIHRECHSVLVELHPITVYMAVFWEHAVPLLNATCCFRWFQPFVSYSMVIRLILGCLWPLVSVLNYILTLGILRSVISPFQDVFVPGPSSRISDSTYHRTPLCHIYILNYNIQQGSFRLCNWLSLWCLVSWINHLPPVCWSTFRISTFKQ